MKIRIRNNAIRMRLLESEVKKLSEELKVSAQVDFPNNKSLKYTLIWSLGDQFGAHFNGREIMVSIPHDAGQTWMETNQLSLEAELKLNSGDSLYLSIQKDY